jgi:hypothetical protein
VGDRGNIIIKDRYSDPVYLYTHWGGTELADTAQQAIRKAAPENEHGQGRWNHGAYLARIVFHAMTGGTDGLTGFGISTREQDNEHPYIVLDARDQTVSIEFPADLYGRGGEPTRTFTMREFADAEDPAALLGFHDDGEGN